MAAGRPRAFDVDDALERALEVFLHKGYEGSSLADLTGAMGINPPSLYAAFGNKEGLFRKALDRYVESRGSVVCEALEAPTAYQVVEKLLRGTIDYQTDSCNAAGCLLVSGALSCGETAAPIQQELIARRSAAETELRKRLNLAKTEGDLPPDSNPAALARYISTVLQGMAVQSTAGATRKELHQIADVVLKTWPSSARSTKSRSKPRERGRPQVNARTAATPAKNTRA